jgi:hypothetical protein
MKIFSFESYFYYFGPEKSYTFEHFQIQIKP